MTEALGGIAGFDARLHERRTGGERLPLDARARLGTFPRSGVALGAPYAPARFVLGPWSWMVLVYDYDEGTDVVTVLAVEDARSSSTLT